jgi:hypothetical protein
MWLSKLDNSKLTDEELETLKEDFAAVMKGEKDKEKYLKDVNKLIRSFRMKVEEFKESEKTWGKYSEEPKTKEGEDKIYFIKIICLH